MIPSETSTILRDHAVILVATRLSAAATTTTATPTATAAAAAAASAATGRSGAARRPRAASGTDGAATAHASAAHAATAHATAAHATTVAPPLTLLVYCRITPPHGFTPSTGATAPFTFDTDAAAALDLDAGAATAFAAELPMASALPELAAESAPPIVPSEWTAPAEALPPPVTAPIPARSVPAIVVPAILAPAPDVLSLLGQRKLIECGSDALRIADHGGVGSAHWQRAGDKQRCRHNDQSRTLHRGTPFVGDLASQHLEPAFVRPEIRKSAQVSGNIREEGTSPALGMTVHEHEKGTHVSTIPGL
jgi:hypothetical protein